MLLVPRRPSPRLIAVALTLLVGAAERARGDEPLPPADETEGFARDPQDTSADAPDHAALVGPGRHDPSQHEFLFVPVPIGVANSDEGIGGGVVLALHHHYGGVEPLRDDLSLRLYLTSKLVQRHELRWEGIQVLDLPLRMWARVGFFSTVSQTFCGYGNGVTCEESEPRAIARDAGLVEGEPAFDDFVRRYFLMRYVRPHADTVMRWRLRDKPHRMELLTGWRLGWYLPGTLLEAGPWPGSLYAAQFPEGEPGVSSVPQLGVTRDNPVFEPAPTQGDLLAASVRGAHPWVGSSWTWAGMNLSLHGYDQLSASPHVVYAGRVLVDLAAGAMPTEEIAEIGGTKDYGAFGGQWIGRGVRDRRYLGKLRVIHQSELRVGVASFDVFGWHLDNGVVAFADLAWIGYDWDNLGGVFPGELWRAGNPLGVVWGAGLGLRILVNRAIVARAEVAASPTEQRSPSFYTPVGNSL